ncbi:MAG: YggS family pyridoxal phosphate-dependent enzyme [Verrucomicrobiota bacterium JB023]|nr:YggS family pyridoxal phosphate-dependent enzyme [Verrucomicrobiota bacterium JB023]
MSSLAARLHEVRQRISDAAVRSGRRADEVRLLAVGKTFPASAIAEAYEAGQIAFGENRVQEALQKQPELPSEIEWHLIGPLQRNKVRKAVGAFHCLQGIDSLRLAEAVSRVAGEIGHTQRILLQVHIGGELSKSGFPQQDLKEQLTQLLALPHLSVAGLMTIPPPVEEPEKARPYFAELRELRDELAEASGCALAELSMGMSGDFEAAIAEGATLVRVGSAIFGHRDYPASS